LHKKKLSNAQKGKPSPMKGKKVSEATKKKLSIANKGKSPPNKGKPMSDGQKKKISDAQKGKKGKKHTEATKKKISDTTKGKSVPKSAREHLSATLQGIPYDEWCEFAKDQKYCPKFNEACKESNREKYGRRCFICGKTEKANGQKLSVHHTDMNKAQGCESNWKLVPLCKHCHATAHNDELIARLGYMIKGN